ncbi:MAG: hypothetical protein ACTS10_01055 [Kiloniellales bacterium]
MSARLFTRDAFRLFFGLPILLIAAAFSILTVRPAVAEPEIAPLVLTPVSRGAALSSDLGPLDARLRLTETDDARLMGGSTGIDLGSLELRAAYDGDLSSLFTAPSALKVSATEALGRLFKRSRSFGLSTALGAARLALAAGTDEEAGGILGAELQVTDSLGNLILQAGGSEAGRRLFGARSSLDLTSRLRIELGGRLEADIESADRRPKATSGLAIGWRDALARGDRLRAQITRSPDGLERLSVGYVALMEVGRLQLRSEGAPDLDEYAARAEWRLEF